MKTKKIVVFDLDDTLYKEIEYLKSAYQEISQKIAKAIRGNKEAIYKDMVQYYNEEMNTFELILEKYEPDLTIGDLLVMYRNHLPDLVLSENAKAVLDLFKLKKIEMGLITDGRSVQQRNKLNALGIESYFSEIVISEEFGTAKPNSENFKYFEKHFGEAQYYYIGDNVKKDFLAPNALGWVTIQLKDNGLNIHKCSNNYNDKSYRAQFEVDELTEILEIIN